MKVNVLRIDEEYLTGNEREYEMNYINLITNKTLELRKDGRLVIDVVTDMFQDEFNFLRITTIGGETKFIIDTIENVDLDKDIKMQQVKDVFERIYMDGNDLSITLQCDGRFLAYIECGDMYVDGYTSNNNESLEDFILRIREPYIEKQQYICK